MAETIILKFQYIQNFILIKCMFGGTADGVNRGIIDDNGCIDWIHYTTFDGLGGNWIIDIVPQYLNNSEFPRIWLVSWDREEYPSSKCYNIYR